VKTLPKLAREASDSTLASAIQKHLAETKQHVTNVEAAFESIGEKPKAEKCPGIEGLKKEHDEFVTGEKPSDDVLDMFLTGAAARTEHYEIAAYTGLITMAGALGETDGPSCLARTSSRRRLHSKRSPPSPRSSPPRHPHARSPTGPALPQPGSAQSPCWGWRAAEGGGPLSGHPPAALARARQPDPSPSDVVPSGRT
jgi:ferritin-like metal-binding protein YciE